MTLRWFLWTVTLKAKTPVLMFRIEHEKVRTDQALTNFETGQIEMRHWVMNAMGG